MSKDGISKTRRVLGGTANEQESETKEGMEGALSRSRLICEWLERCAACQGQTDRWCTSCAMPWCSWCCPETRECFGCGQNAPAKGIRKRSKAGESNLGRLYGRNMHQVGACFVDEVTACRWVNEAERPGPETQRKLLSSDVRSEGKSNRGARKKFGSFCKERTTSSCGRWWIKSPKSYSSSQLVNSLERLRNLKQRDGGMKHGRCVTYKNATAADSRKCRMNLARRKGQLAKMGGRLCVQPADQQEGRKAK